MNKIEANKALSVALPENDTGADTVRGYLAILLSALLVKEEEFNSKRPFGNSGWIYDITDPLNDAGFDTRVKGFFADLVNELCGVEDS